MAPARRPKHEPTEGALHPSQVLAANVRAARGLLNLSQQHLAERMSALGHTWSRPTVSQIERGERAVSVDELFGLSHALGVHIPLLLSPPQAPEVNVDTGLPHLLPTWAVRGMMRLESPFDPSITWENNTPIRIDYPGSQLLEDVLRAGGSSNQVAFFRDMLEHTKKLEERQ